MNPARIAIRKYIIFIQQNEGCEASRVWGAEKIQYDMKRGRFDEEPSPFAYPRELFSASAVLIATCKSLVRGRLADSIMAHFLIPSLHGETAVSCDP